MPSATPRSPDPQNQVADKMLADFTNAQAAALPLFFLHLGDVIYNFGERRYYYDQFYDPYRNYPAPIVALAGNHDSMIAPDTYAITLDAYLENFCADVFRITPEAGGLGRTSPQACRRALQPGYGARFASLAAAARLARDCGPCQALPLASMASAPPGQAGAGLPATDGLGVGARGRQYTNCSDAQAHAMKPRPMGRPDLHQPRQNAPTPRCPSARTYLTE